MAVITSTNTDRTLAFPGGRSAVKLNIKNDASSEITGIKIQFKVFGNDLGTNAGTVECGYAIGSDDAFADISIAAGKSVEISGFVEPPAEVESAFASGVRFVPLYQRYTVKYKNGTFFGGMDTVIENIYVLNHRYNPQVLKFELKRAESGIPNDEGEDVLTTLKLGLEDPSKTDFMGLTLYYAENEQVTTNSASIDLTAKIPQLLTGVVDDSSTIFNSFSNGSNWNFLLVFGDEYESTGLMMDIARAFANVHLSGKPEGGVCFGGFCANDTDATGKVIPKFECYYPAYFYGGIALGGAGDYSLEEQDTGSKWIDGKPIYRKVFTGTIKAATTTDIATNIGFETVIRCDGILSYVNSSGMTVQRSLNFFSSTSLHSRVYTGTSDGGKIQTNSTQAGDVHVVLEYTKATDAATTEVTKLGVQIQQNKL